MHAGRSGTGLARALAAGLIASAVVGALILPAAVLASGLAPTPVNDAPTVNEDATLVINVLANDTDPENDALHIGVAAAIPGAYGTGSWQANGTLTFTPKADWSGTVPALWYRANDGTASTQAWVTITVVAVDDPPHAVDDALVVGEDATVDVTAELLANDTDPEDDPLTVTAVANVTGGSVELAAGAVTFSPTADLCGATVASFDYTVQGSVASDDGHVTISVTCVDDPPAAADDTVPGLEDTPLAIPGASLLDNDADPDPGDVLAVTDASGATGGSVAVESGVVTFTPDDDLCGDGAGGFDYTMSDGTTTDGAHVTVDLGCANDPPVAEDDTATVGQASAPADHDVLANDTDVDGDDLVVSDPEVDPAAGTVSVVGNEIRFASAPAFTGDALIGYTVGDGEATDTGLLTVSVIPDDTDPVPVAPAVTFGSGRVNETAPLLVTWSATDAETGIKGYEVQARTGQGAWVTVYTGTGTSMQAFYPFGADLQWQVRATDNADNVSGWATSAVRRLVAYQGGSPVATTGTWTKVTKAAASGMGYRYTTDPGKRVRLSFTGLGVLYVAPRVRAGGHAKVTIDGVTTRVSLGAGGTFHGVIVASRLWGAAGTHTITVANDQGGRRTTFDAFIVLQ